MAASIIIFGGRTSASARTKLDERAKSALLTKTKKEKFCFTVDFFILLVSEREL